MEKSAGIIESTVSSGGQERLGIRFTIDYLLYNKGSGNSREELEANDAIPLGLRGEPSQGTLQENFGLGIECQEKGAKGLEGQNGGKNEGQGNIGSGDPPNKPSQSYIALISMAILASEEKKLLLSDIYQWIMDHYPYFKSKDKRWRNSVRHNLSLNECFIKAGRSNNGKGHFWTIHPTNLQDFSKGDYHHRCTRRRIRRATGRIPYPMPTVHNCIPCLRCTPLWRLPPDLHLSCIPTRMYWSWATLPAYNTPPHLSLLPE